MENFSSPVRLSARALTEISRDASVTMGLRLVRMNKFLLAGSGPDILNENGRDGQEKVQIIASLALSNEYDDYS